MRFAFVIAAAALIIPTAAPAQSMNADSFMQRANKLKAKGPLALLQQGEIKALMNEGKGGYEAARRQRLAAVKAGKKPRYCPPEAPQKMDSDEFMTRLAAIPSAQRKRIDMTEATTRILSAKYPCR